VATSPMLRRVRACVVSASPKERSSNTTSSLIPSADIATAMTASRNAAVLGSPMVTPDWPPTESGSVRLTLKRISRVVQGGSRARAGPRQRPGWRDFWKKGRDGCAKIPPRRLRTSESPSCPPRSCTSAGTGRLLRGPSQTRSAFSWDTKCSTRSIRRSRSGACSMRSQTPTLYVPPPSLNAGCSSGLIGRRRRDWREQLECRGSDLHHVLTTHSRFRCAVSHRALSWRRSASRRVTRGAGASRRFLLSPGAPPLRRPGQSTSSRWLTPAHSARRFVRSLPPPQIHF
jgi:hypothetical protein